MSRVKGSSYKNELLKLTSGLINNLTDLCLFTIFFHLQSYQIAYGKKNIGGAINEAIHLTKIVHPYNLNRLIYRAKTRGYLERKEEYYKITQLGQDRLKKLLPSYEQKRPWDGILYLITYDIPEILKKDRDQLRSYLKKLGCGLMQESVWITPYNPKKIIIDFVRERSIAGLVLVSELREGSAIGGKEIKEALVKIYHLEQINEKYEDFIDQVKKQKLSFQQLIFTYMVILKDDPQLPFALLPSWWLGEEAYKIYKSALSDTRPRVR